VSKAGHHPAQPGPPAPDGRVGPIPATWPAPAPLLVVWHDVECGAYVEDLPLWRSLAAEAGGPVLDVGAGTGRVALDLARHGHAVVALDSEQVLLAELERRATGLPVSTVCSDARSFAIDGRRFPLVLVPMQTLQLLGGRQGRSAFLRCARAHLTSGGLVAIALADALDGVDDDHCAPPLPDVRTVDGVVYASHPVGLRDEGDRVAIERIRETIAAGGRRTASDDVVLLDRVDAATLEREAQELGFTARPAGRIAETDEYVGSIVVMLGG
jgi:SAM-dependent methyltransferase